MADDKKIIFSMVGVGKLIPPSRQILKDIYLSFFYGAKIGIIGLNGSGKSSLMKIIAGVDKDYQGEVVFSPGYSVGYLMPLPSPMPTSTSSSPDRENSPNCLRLTMHGTSTLNSSVLWTPSAVPTRTSW